MDGIGIGMDGSLGGVLIKWSFKYNLQCYLGVDNLEDGLDEVVFVGVQHIRQVTSHLSNLFVRCMDRERVGNKGKDEIQDCVMIQGG